MSPNIYHISHIGNLASILRHGGILAYNELQRNSLKYTDVAHDFIQDRRASLTVPCAEGGTLHDYVPFYFAPRSPMLYTLHRGNVEGYSEGQTPILHFVVDVQKIVSREISFTFTDGHAIVRYSCFYDKCEDLEAIDWDIMKARYWADTNEDGDRKRRRQAEFLIYKCCPWDFISSIGVINKKVQKQVELILQELPNPPQVRIQTSWYY
ncbi:DUF4433 domain-containing protein [Oxynema sp. CENA135]|uniref:type II toxin-antitoxin system toxin DNA ADP-ribosyl transferase DarT n=1 Tax=Oxynema sp. CENA135 TaxID=984206 RepID=UPI00190AF83E|nr:DUF4433 domain-containing protein [Oxynema sp. CENA135]MBK4729311.1 DUF4433 domain-containing protein [Oxynema sp. CENA135]